MREPDRPAASDRTTALAPRPCSREERLFIWQSSGWLDGARGERIRRDWTVVRYDPGSWRRTAPDRRVDVTRPLPFAAGRFQAIYACRIVQHLTRDEGRALFDDLARLLRGGGVLRVSVPDVEEIARSYLAAIDACRQHLTPERDQRRRELALQLTDQMMRDVSGGQLAAEIRSGRLGAERLRERFGDCLDGLLPAAGRTPRRGGRLNALKRGVRQAVRLALGQVRFQDVLARRETDLWIYDRVMITRLAEEAGFRQVEFPPSDRSRIAGWQDWGPDRSVRGDYCYEPSLFAECVRESGADAR